VHEAARVGADDDERTEDELAASARVYAREASGLLVANDEQERTAERRASILKVGIVRLA
jgi:hypothetical protein